MMIDQFDFVRSTELGPTDDRVFRARIDPGIDSVDALMETYARQLKFPPYFGMNWDAFYDCIRDFHWLTQTRIEVCHADVPAIGDTWLTIYCELLADAVSVWKQRGLERELVVCFPRESRSEIERIFSLQ